MEPHDKATLLLHRQGSVIRAKSCNDLKKRIRAEAVLSKLSILILLFMRIPIARIIAVMREPLFEIVVAKTLIGFFTIGKAGVPQIRIEIDTAAERAFDFYVIFPEFDFSAALDTPVQPDIFRFEIRRVHSRTAESHQ